MKPLCYMLLACLPACSQNPVTSGPQQNTGSNLGPKARVFITDSVSWQSRGSAAGARPQTAEIIKTFGERCDSVTANDKRDNADYIIVLDHEGGKGALRVRNKIAVFEAASGDALMSGSTRSIGNSVKDACDAIDVHWASHWQELRKPQSQASSVPVVAPVSAINQTSVPMPRISVSSTPEAADIEIDGKFVGNTPSSIEIPLGDHQVSIIKKGFTTWERKLSVTGGDIKVSAELDPK